MKKLGLLIIVASAIYFIWPLMYTAPGAVHPSLTLNVNGGSTVRISPGTPLALDIYLQSKDKLRLGGFLKAWPEFVTLRLQDSEEEPPWRLDPLAQPRGVFAQQSEDEFKIGERDGAAAQFDGSNGYYLLQLGLSPEESAKLTLGTYHIVAILEARRFLIGPKEEITQSGAISIVVDNGADSELRVDRLFGAAKFYVKAKKFDDALDATDELIKMKPESPDPYIVHGDALAGLGRKEDALEVYLHARRLLPPSYEEPVLLNRRILNVLQR